ncbi:MAG: aminotransferase class I/II-fold pyridoxal phosphate-dependent enzyme, partial [Trichodesmium sp. MAG_R01]|nr:aminotransferase class I/II-fold pyridoxal phosphate-dependent enzyme [Trichodesmium sp. MAG_R01]
MRIRERAEVIKNKNVSLFDKTPRYMQKLPNVLERVPDIPCIVIVKDIRSVFWSSYKRAKMTMDEWHKKIFKRTCNHTLSYAKGWKEAIEKGLEKRILLIKYEELCLDQKTEVKKIFDFLGREFQESYLTFNNPKYNNVYGGDISTQYLTEYKGNLPEYICEEILELTSEYSDWLWSDRQTDKSGELLPSQASVQLKSKTSSSQQMIKEDIDNPENPQFYRLLAINHREKGDIEKAIVNYQKAIEIGPQGSFWNHKDLGDIFKSQERWNEAIAAYEDALKLNPEHLVLCRSLAVAQVKAGRLEESIDSYRRVIELNPQHFRNYKDLGDILLQKGRLEEVALNYQKAVNCLPENYWSRTELGLILSKLNRKKEAMDALKIAISLPKEKKDFVDPQLGIKVYAEFLKLKRESGELEEAISYCDRVIGLKPENKIVYSLFANALEKNGLLARAIPFYHKAVGINQEDLVKIGLRLKAETNNKTNYAAINKILFVVCYVPNNTNSSHLQLILDYSIFIVEYFSNISVDILITNENYLVHQHSFSFNTEHINILHERLKTLKKVGKNIENKISFIYGNPESDNYFLELANQLTSVMPDIVVFLGGVYSTRIFTEIFYQFYPTVFMQFNLTNNPANNFDIYLSCGKVKDYSNFINPERWRHHNYLYNPNAKQKKGTKNIVKTSPETIALVTVTSNLNKRLVDNSIITNVVQILKKYPEVCWVLVGATDREELLSRDEDFQELASQDRVKIIKYEADLRALYEQCDIYIHHRISGGGYGIALAVCENLPVLVYEESDACNFLDESVIFGHNEDYFQFLEKLICEPELRKSVGSKLKALMDMRSGENAVKEFIGFCEEARANFIQRKNLNPNNISYMKRNFFIPFNKPNLAGSEFAYLEASLKTGKISGDGSFTKKCHTLLETELGVAKVLLTTSCTHALEMAAILLNIQAGDEVIVPSFTFVSTVNAFVLRGAKPVFLDVRPDTLNLDEAKLEKLITSKTRAIVPVHYAGVGCEMDKI